MMIGSLCQLHQRLLSILRDSPAVVGSRGLGIKPPDIIDVTDPLKAVSAAIPPMGAGRLPMLVLLPYKATFTPAINNKSCGSKRQFVIAINTSTQMLSAGGRNPLTVYTAEELIMLAFATQPVNLGLPGFVFGYSGFAGAEKGWLDQFPWIEGLKQGTALWTIEVDVYWNIPQLFQEMQALA